jgi:hypothetical protein
LDAVSVINRRDACTRLNIISVMYVCVDFLEVQKYSILIYFSDIKQLIRNVSFCV